MATKDKPAAPATQRERPPIYVRASGRLYVKTDELLDSKRGRAALEAMRKVAAKQEELDELENRTG